MKMQKSTLEIRIKTNNKNTMDKKRIALVAVLGFLVISALGLTLLGAMGPTENIALLEAREDRAYLETKKISLLPYIKELALVEANIIETQATIDNIVNGKEAEKANLESGNFELTGGGIDEFLEVNAAGFVKEKADLFEAAGKLYQVEPALLVCIAQADSSLGNALKSSNNIGNVGNSDSGATRDFKSLELAIAGIAQTLNNRYMGGLTHLGQLSGGGREILGSKYTCSNAPSPFKCYATSPFNWNKNTKLCLQDILQDPTIDETFEFRTQ